MWKQCPISSDVDDNEMNLINVVKQMNLDQHGENVPQVAVFVHRRQVVQDALCKYWNLGNDDDNTKGQRW